jgi:initiation factor 1A
MVRNIQGGTGTKSLARKNQDTGKSYKKLRVSEDPAEIYAYVGKAFGNGMCQIFANDGTEYMGHIRGKMRGQHKRSNLISPMSVVLVGLRVWESETSGKKRNCDIITVYDDNEVEQLTQIPNIHIDDILAKRLTGGSSSTSKKGEADLFDRTAEDDAEVLPDIGKMEEFECVANEQVDIEDI